MFRAGWKECPIVWQNHILADEFEALKEIRDVTLKSLESARLKSFIGSSLESEIHIQTDEDIQKVIQEKFSAVPPNYSLEDFLIVSKTHLTVNELPQEIDFKESGSISFKGRQYPVSVGVAKASRSKCGRCWRYLAPPDSSNLCERCATVV